MSICSQIPYFFPLVLVLLQYLPKGINTDLLSLLVAHLPNHLNPMATHQNSYLPTYLLPTNSHLHDLSEFSSAFLTDRQMKLLTRSVSLGQAIQTKSPSGFISFLYFHCHENEKLQIHLETAVCSYSRTYSVSFYWGTRILVLAHTLMDKTLARCKQCCHLHTLAIQTTPSPGSFLVS